MGAAERLGKEDSCLDGQHDVGQKEAECLS